MKSWKCIDNCGACCKIDLKERASLSNILSKEDIKLIESMTNKDGWCKHLNRSNMKCLIYDKRPHFCKVDSFSKNFKEYFKYGDEFLVNCCKDHISSIYGKKSNEMTKFKKSTLSK